MWSHICLLIIYEVNDSVLTARQCHCRRLHQMSSWMRGTILSSSLKGLMIVTDDRCPSSKQKRPKFLTLTLYVVILSQCPYMQVISKFVVDVTFTVILNPLFAIRPETENRLFKVPSMNGCELKGGLLCPDKNFFSSWLPRLNQIKVVGEWISWPPISV